MTWLWGALLLAALIAGTYSSVFSNSFIVYDDPIYVTSNAYVRAGLTGNTVAWAWRSIHEAGFWFPLTWISHALDVELFGLDPAGHHFTSLLIHIVNAVLLLLLLSRVTPAVGRCFIVAALFGLHPLAVESISWASERKNVLCTLFFLLAIAAYGCYVRRPTASRYLLVMIAFFLGLASKPMIVTLPFVLLLLDFWPLRRVKDYGSLSPIDSVRQFPIAQLVLEKLPLLALAVGSSVLTILTQSSVRALTHSAVLSPTARLANAVNSYFTYILSAVWPVNLAPFYPEAPLPAWRVVLGAAFVLIVSAAAWAYRVKRPYLVIGWLFYLGTLFPVIGIVQAGGWPRTTWALRCCSAEEFPKLFHISIGRQVSIPATQ